MMAMTIPRLFFIKKDFLEAAAHNQHALIDARNVLLHFAAAQGDVARVDLAHQTWEVSTANDWPSLFHRYTVSGRTLPYFNGNEPKSRPACAEFDSNRRESASIACRNDNS